MPDPIELHNETAAALRAAVADSFAGERAAVDLLIWKGWPHRQDFLRACTSTSDGRTYINWAKAREFADRAATGGFGAPKASGSEVAILDLAAALGEDRFRLSALGSVHKAAAVEAFAAACGVDLAATALATEALIALASALEDQAGRADGERKETLAACASMLRGALTHGGRG